MLHLIKSSSILAGKFSIITLVSLFFLTLLNYLFAPVVCGMYFVTSAESYCYVNSDPLLLTIAEFLIIVTLAIVSVTFLIKLLFSESK
ncbi:hypothetical protein LIS04_168 [Listeria phage LIS04]|nr:hypothetical protein LIS04_168 [Listeria phage LIS04]